MSTLLNKANQILQEKTSKIIPENIKEDIQIFDVLGTCTAGVHQVYSESDMYSLDNVEPYDFCIIKDPYYNIDIINRIRQLMNNKYLIHWDNNYPEIVSEYGSFQNNNMILYNKADEHYYALFSSDTTSNIETTIAIATGKWKIRGSGSWPMIVNAPYYIVQLYRYDEDADDMVLYNEESWGSSYSRSSGKATGLYFPTKSGSDTFDWHIVYFDKEDFTNLYNSANGQVVYEGVTYHKNERMLAKEIMTGVLGLYQYNGSNWNSVLDLKTYGTKKITSNSTVNVKSYNDALVNVNYPNTGVYQIFDISELANLSGHLNDLCILYPAFTSDGYVERTNILPFKYIKLKQEFTLPSNYEKPSATFSGDSKPQWVNTVFRSSQSDTSSNWVIYKDNTAYIQFQLGGKYIQYFYSSNDGLTFTLTDSYIDPDFDVNRFIQDNIINLTEFEFYISKQTDIDRYTRTIGYMANFVKNSQELAIYRHNGSQWVQL